MADENPEQVVETQEEAEKAPEVPTEAAAESEEPATEAEAPAEDAVVKEEDTPQAAEETPAAEPQESPEEQKEEQKEEVAADDVAEAETAVPTESSGEAQEEESGEIEQPVEEGEQDKKGETPKPEEGEATEQGEEAGEEKEESGENEVPAEGSEETAEGADVPKPEGESDTPAADGEEAVPQEGMEDIQEGDEEAAKSPVPQSDTFAEGEKPESPTVAVGEKLSREGSPVADEEQLMTERTMSPPVPGTPDRASLHGSDDQEEEEEEEEYDDEDEPQFNRDELIERYHQALSERQQLQEQNYQLQHKLAEYFRRKKADERQDMDKNVTDQEQRYLKYIANLDELRRQDTEERESFKQQIEETRDRCDDRTRKVEDEQQKFKEFKKEVAHGALNSRSGKPIPAKDVEQHFINESRKEEEVVKVRLENIKLKNKLKKKEAQLKSKEELAEGLHMIDFEQLKIENQTYNEKIEERNEELLKLRKKITSTVQVLTHLKEKLQFVQGENGTLKTTLRDVEELAAKKRDILSRTKQARDGLRIDNQRLRQNSGLLGNEPLLRDFEERKDESDDLKDKLEQLKMQHAELTLNLNGVRRKIQQAQVGRQ